MQNTEKSLYLLMATLIAGLALAGVAHAGPAAAVQGFWLLQSVPARLIHDFTLTGGPGGALLNAAALGAIVLMLVRLNRIRLSGPTVAAVCTVIGFSLFGKTPVNALPVMAGVYLAGRLAGKPFRNYILIAMFGTALGPLVTGLAVEAGIPGLAGLAAGAAGGLAAGLVLPSLAMAMLRLHAGYNLYNIGLTCGFFGLFAASLFAAAGRDISIRVVWSEDLVLILAFLIPAVSVAFAAWGIALGGKGVLAGFWKLQKLTGRLPSDFMEQISVGPALLNMGLLGLAGCAYVALVGGVFNGPVIGGLFTLMGFGAFGKHLRNTAPVVLGIFAATLLFGKSLAAPGPLLALLFGTTLAPIAGEFGILAGITAGFLHLVLVERTAAWHGGLDLYNNGFAGGLTAGLMAAVIEWVRSNKPEK